MYCKFTIKGSMGTLGFRVEDFVVAWSVLHSWGCCGLLLQDRGLTHKLTATAT